MPGIDEHSVTGEQDQLTVGGRMDGRDCSSTTYVLRAQQIVADEAIDDVDFPTPGRAEQCTGPSGPEVVAENAPRRLRSHGMIACTGTAGASALHLLDVPFRMVDEVRLVQHDDGRGAALQATSR